MFVAKHFFATGQLARSALATSLSFEKEEIINLQTFQFRVGIKGVTEFVVEFHE